MTTEQDGREHLRQRLIQPQYELRCQREQHAAQAESQRKKNEGCRIGARGQLATSEVQRCVSIIAQTIKREWNKESFKWHPGLQPLQVSLNLDMDGCMLGFSILRGSGDRDVDLTVQNALKRIKSISGLSVTFLEHFPKIALLMEPTEPTYGQ
jgi:hypothetical protein